jgi:cytochrome c biogenesis protein CcmG/thiol:disulfide interchange protein DsbE
MSTTKEAGRILVLLGQRLARLIGRHRVISSVAALFVAAAIAVSLVSSGGGAASGSAAASSGGAASGAGAYVVHSNSPAPGFTLAALGQAAKKVSLSQYQGKPVIVNFWASWCGPCQQETPLLARWYKQQHGHVVLLGLDENDSVASALSFARAKGVTYPIGFDPNVTVASAYGVDGLPQTFFLNAKHHIVYHILGAATQAELATGRSLMDGPA